MNLELTELLKTGLLSEVRKDLINDIVSETLADAEKKLREELRPRVENLSLTKVQEFQDALSMRRTLEIAFNWTPEPGLSSTPKEK